MLSNIFNVRMGSYHKKKKKNTKQVVHVLPNVHTAATPISKNICLDFYS